MTPRERLNNTLIVAVALDYKRSPEKTDMPIHELSIELLQEAWRWYKEFEGEMWEAVMGPDSEAPRHWIETQPLMMALIREIEAKLDPNQVKPEEVSAQVRVGPGNHGLCVLGAHVVYYDSDTEDGKATICFGKPMLMDNSPEWQDVPLRELRTLQFAARRGMVLTIDPSLLHWVTTL